LLFPLMWIAILFFGCNSYPSMFAKSRAMLTNRPQNLLNN
jgi:hypothetical protein